MINIFSWDELLNSFRALGGRAENICLRNGSRGRGVFPVNSSLDSSIIVPNDLLIETKDIFLKQGKIKVRPESQYSDNSKQFFECYQQQYGWGGKGREEVEKFERSLKTLPENVLKYMSDRNFLSLDLRHKGNWEECIFRLFIQSREVEFGGKKFLAPIWDLVNHDIFSPPCIFKNQIHTYHKAGDSEEFLHDYGPSTPIQRLLSHGFSSPEKFSFSGQFSLSSPDLKKTLLCNGNIMFDDSFIVEETDSSYQIDYLTLVNSICPDQPYNAFINQIKGFQSGIDLFKLFKFLKDKNLNELNELEKLLNDSSSDICNLFNQAVHYEMSIY